MVRKTWTDVQTETLACPETQAGYDLARCSYEFGQRVRERRTEAGMTQKDLAQKLNTSQSAIARLEAGGTQPHVQTILALASALDVDWSFGDNGVAVVLGRNS